MLAQVAVVERTDFDTWVAEQQKTVTPEQMAELGEGTSREPGLRRVPQCQRRRRRHWTDLEGHVQARHRRSPTARRSRADEEYLRNSIVNPTSEVVAGYTPVMPQTYADVLSGQQLRRAI